MPLGMEVGFGPGDNVLDGDPAPLPQRGTAPNFRSMSIVTKRSPIPATAEHLLNEWPSILTKAGITRGVFHRQIKINPLYHPLHIDEFPL